MNISGFIWKYIGKYLSGEILLTRECSYQMGSNECNSIAVKQQR
jgi:hypothetical protein